MVGTAKCSIMPERHPPATGSPWVSATDAVVQQFSDLSIPQMDKGVRTVLWEHLNEVWDFESRCARDRKLGEWLDVMSRIMRMLRSSSVANVSPVTASTAPP